MSVIWFSILTAITVLSWSSPVEEIPPASAIAELELTKSFAIFSIDSVEIPVSVLVFSRVKSDKLVKVLGIVFLLSLFILI